MGRGRSGGFRVPFGPMSLYPVHIGRRGARTETGGSKTTDGHRTGHSGRVVETRPADRQDPGRNPGTENHNLVGWVEDLPTLRRGCRGVPGVGPPRVPVPPGTLCVSSLDLDRGPNGLGSKGGPRLPSPPAQDWAPDRLSTAWSVPTGCGSATTPPPSSSSSSVPSLSVLSMGVHSTPRTPETPLRRPDGQ